MPRRLFSGGNWSGNCGSVAGSNGYLKRCPIGISLPGPGRAELELGLHSKARSPRAARPWSRPRSRWRRVFPVTFPGPNIGAGTASWRPNWNSGKAVRAACTIGFGSGGKRANGRSRACSPEVSGHVQNQPLEIAGLAVSSLCGVVCGLSEPPQNADRAARSDGGGDQGIFEQRRIDHL